MTVELSRSRYPEATLHFAVAWDLRAPRHYTIARNRADRNRAAWQPYVKSGVAGAYIPYIGAWTAGAVTVLIALGANGTDAALAMAVIALLRTASFSR